MAPSLPRRPTSAQGWQMVKGLGFGALIGGVALLPNFDRVDIGAALAVIACAFAGAMLGGGIALWMFMHLPRVRQVPVWPFLVLGAVGAAIGQTLFIRPA